MTTLEKVYKLYLSGHSICTDTRKISQDSLFFALKGGNFNGNQFASQALASGAAYAIIDDDKFICSEDCILVSDVLVFLQQLAKHHRNNLSIPIIGITGTNGKTTTKELIFSVLSKKHNAFATKGNLNNHIGVPLSILSIRKEYDLAIIEMGANHQNEIQFLCSIANPTHGIITNIGKAHLEGFGGIEGVIKTKRELYEHLEKVNGTIFYNDSNSTLTSILPEATLIPFSTIPSEARITGFVDSLDPFLHFHTKVDNQSTTIHTQLIGEYNLENFLAALCIGEHFQVPLSDMKSALEDYAPKNHRSQMVITEQNKVILDAYNANPTSMMAALQSFKNSNSENKLCILGDMLELGSDSIIEHQKIIDFLITNSINCVLIGKEFKSIGSFLPSFNTSVEATQSIQELVGEQPHLVLIKGSRGIRLESLLPLF